MNDADLPSSWVVSSLGAVVNYGRTTKVEPSDIADDAWVLELEDIEKAPRARMVVVPLVLVSGLAALT